jgi:para-aminobenzoate synthetase component 1
MGRVLATELLAISEDPCDLNDGGFWAVCTSFEGKNTFAKFAQIERSKPFPIFDPWEAIETTWRSSLSESQYLDYVEKIRSEIEKGVVYQVNACRVLETELPESSLGSLFQLLLAKNPAPHASYLRLPNLEIVSASPELFLQRTGDGLKCSPIKGSRKISKSKEPFDEKDQSENVMIVDLMRNDFSRICESVEVGAILRSEIHPGIEHLVSDVYGRLKADTSWESILKELSPAGSISGTPKSSAVKLIRDCEPVDRGPYCGLLGWIEKDQAQLSVAIRTFWRDGKRLKFGTGAGITWSSNSKMEWEETQLKAGKLIGLCGGLQESEWPFGSGLFETLRMQDGKVHLLHEHIERVRKSGKALGISIPSEYVINSKISDLGKLRLGRLRLTFGENFTATLIPYVDPTSPLKIVVVERANQADFDQYLHKTYPYDSNLEILKNVRSCGFDEALLRNPDGEISEGAISNFIFRIEGFWVTPPLSAGLLPGIIRQKVLESGLAIEATVMESDLSKVTHAFAISSLRIATPVETIDGRVLGLDEVSKVWRNKLRQFLKVDSVG